MARRAPARFSTERSEHKSAADGRICASPVPSARRKCANMRPIFGFSAERAGIADCLADGVEFEPSRLFISRRLPRFYAHFPSPQRNSRRQTEAETFSGSLSIVSTTDYDDPQSQAVQAVCLFLGRAVRRHLPTP